MANALGMCATLSLLNVRFEWYAHEETNNAGIEP